MLTGGLFANWQKSIPLELSRSASFFSKIKDIHRKKKAAAKINWQ